MKLAKYTLLVMGILGLTASIYNSFYNQSTSGQIAGFIAGIFLIFVSLNLNKFIHRIESQKKS